MSIQEGTPITAGTFPASTRSFAEFPGGISLAEVSPVSPDLEVRVHPDRAGNLRVGLRGELDGHTAPLLEVVLNAADHHGRLGRPVGTVIFDLAEVKFIYMRGIAVLQEVCVRLSRAGWHVSLTNARPNVADLLAIARQHQSLMLTGPQGLYEPALTLAAAEPAGGEGRG